MRPHCFSSIISPVRKDEFLDRHYGREMLHIPGQRGRFADLMPWSAINDLLAHHRLESKLKVFKGGAMAPQESYVIRRHDSKRNPLVLVPELLKLLAEGATLVIDSVDELREPVAALIRSVERALCKRVGANMYVTWKTTGGFDMHWDDHDTLILQITGRKRWEVFGETKGFPLDKGREEVPAPAGPPIWDRHLEDGDVLYLPRGWWHRVTPCDEATVHLTIGLPPVTALDMLHWLFGQLSEAEIMRRELPSLEEEDVRLHFMDSVRETVVKALEGDCIGAFAKAAAPFAEPRTWPGLPWSVQESALPDDACGIVVLLSPLPLPILRTEEPGVIEAQMFGKTFRFNDATEPLFEYLQQHELVKTEEFYLRWDELYDRGQLRLFLSDLVKCGIVGIYDEREFTNGQHADAAFI